MSAYLKIFDLEHSPFDAKAQAQVVLGTRAIRDAFAKIESGIESGGLVFVTDQAEKADEESLDYLDVPPATEANPTSEE